MKACLTAAAVSTTNGIEELALSMDAAPTAEAVSKDVLDTTADVVTDTPRWMAGLIEL